MTKSRTLRTVLGLAVFSLIFGVGDAYAQQEPQQVAAEEADDTVEPVVLTVSNTNWADMRIYAVRDGRRHRLGIVRSFRSEDFELPARLHAVAEELRLLAVPIGARPSVISPVILVNPGDELEWKLHSNLALSGTPIG